MGYPQQENQLTSTTQVEVEYSYGIGRIRIVPGL